MVTVPTTCDRCGGPVRYFGSPDSVPGLVTKLLVACVDAPTCSGAGQVTVTYRRLRPLEARRLRRAIGQPGQ